jgi:hypothetical protein
MSLRTLHDADDPWRCKRGGCLLYLAALDQSGMINETKTNLAQTQISEQG